MAYEQVSLYGVPIIARRPVGYGRINPAEARAIFIRSALVEGQWRTRHHFYRDNELLRREAEALEERTRRRDLLVDDDTIFAFYDARLPAEVTSVAHFDAWWKKARPADAGPAAHDPGRPDHRGGGSGCRGLPRDLGGRWPPVAGRLRVRARRPGDGVTVTVPGLAAQPAATGALQLAGARVCGPSSPPSCSAPCPRRSAASSCRPRTSPRGPWLGSSRSRRVGRSGRRACRRPSVARCAA